MAKNSFNPEGPRYLEYYLDTSTPLLCIIAYREGKANEDLRPDLGETKLILFSEIVVQYLRVIERDGRRKVLTVKYVRVDGIVAPAQIPL